MARPTREDSIYRMSIHMNGGYMYASTHPYTVTPEAKRKYSILHWGTVDQNLKFVPGGYFSDVDPQNGHVDPLVGFISKN